MGRRSKRPHVSSDSYTSSDCDSDYHNMSHHKKRRRRRRSGSSVPKQYYHRKDRSRSRSQSYLYDHKEHRERRPARSKHGKQQHDRYSDDRMNKSNHRPARSRSRSKCGKHYDPHSDDCYRYSEERMDTSNYKRQSDHRPARSRSRSKHGKRQHDRHSDDRMNKSDHRPARSRSRSKSDKHYYDRHSDDRKTKSDLYDHHSDRMPAGSKSGSKYSKWEHDHYSEDRMDKSKGQGDNRPARSRSRSKCGKERKKEEHHDHYSEARMDKSNNKGHGDHRPARSRSRSKCGKELKKEDHYSEARMDKSKVRPARSGSRSRCDEQDYDWDSEDTDHSDRGPTGEKGKMLQSYPCPMCDFSSGDVLVFGKHVFDEHRDPKKEPENWTDNSDSSAVISNTDPNVFNEVDESIDANNNNESEIAPKTSNRNMGDDSNTARGNSQKALKGKKNVDKTYPRSKQQNSDGVQYENEANISMGRQAKGTTLNVDKNYSHGKKKQNCELLQASDAVFENEDSISTHHAMSHEVSKRNINVDNTYPHSRKRQNSELLQATDAVSENEHGISTHHAMSHEVSKRNINVDKTYPHSRKRHNSELRQALDLESENDADISNDLEPDILQSKKTVVCPYCDADIDNNVLLKKHIDEKHQIADKSYPCHLCNFVTRDPEEFGRHFVEKHQQDQKGVTPTSSLMERFEKGKGISVAKFQKHVQECGFIEVEVPGNGFCFVSSLLVGLAEQGINKNYNNLSIEIMNEISIYHSITFDYEAGKNNEKEKFMDSCAAFLERGDYTNEFVDIVIGSAANALGINLLIFQKTGNSVKCVTVLCRRFTSKINLHLVYHTKAKTKFAKGADSHYNALLKMEYYKSNELAIKSRMIVTQDNNDAQLQKDIALAQRLSLNESQGTDPQTSGAEQSIGEMLGTTFGCTTGEESEDDYVEVRIPRAEFEDFFCTCVLFEIDYGQGVPAIVTLSESSVEESFLPPRNTSTTRKKSNYTTGDKRAGYVEGLSTKNLKYTELDLKKNMGKDVRTKLLGALRARRYRVNQKNAQQISKTKRPVLDPEKRKKIREQGKLSSSEDQCTKISEKERKRSTNTEGQQRFRKEKKKREEANSKKRKSRLDKKIVSSLTKTLQSPTHLKCSLEGCSIDTPMEFKKKIRQRVSTCNTKLPKQGHFKCFVLGRMVKRVMNSPSTGWTMRRVLDKHHTSPQDRDAIVLQGILRRIIRYKVNKDVKRFHHAVDDFKRKASLRMAAEKLNMHYSTLQRLIRFSGSLSQRSVSEADKNKVREFYSCNQVSLQLPFKKYARYYYLRSSLAVAYQQYVVEQRKLNLRVLSKTAVYRCLKGKFRTRKKIPFKDCQCHTCLNASLLADALIAAGVKGISRSNTENVMRSYCPIEHLSGQNIASRKLEWDGKNGQNHVLTDHDRDCIYRDCPRCGAVNILQEDIKSANPNIDWGKVVTWRQWEKIELDLEKDSKVRKEVEGETVDEKKERKKKIFDKVRYNGTLAQLLTSFVKSIQKLSVHIFDFRWQAFQFDECKKLLREGDVLMIMDFAQNFSHHRQDEIQSALWSRQQTTLHPVVTYYPCLEKSCDYLVKEEIMLLSSDLKHDGFAVNKFLEKAMDHLKGHNIPVRRIIMYSDNCGTQYKSCKVFDTLSKQEIPVLRNYFGASHGKGEADGAIGRLSMVIDSVVREGTIDIGNCKDLADYCRRHQTVGDHERGMCCHYHRYYYEVGDIERIQDPDVRTVQGTRSFHSVRNTGISGLIEVRASSCFCEQCFLGIPGECKNKRLVKPFEWASLYKSKCPKAAVAKTVTILDNTLWNNTSGKYIPKKVRKKKTKIRQKSSTSYSCSSDDDDDDSSIASSSDSANSYETDSDATDIELGDQSFDSDFESNIPLTKLNRYLVTKQKKSPICSRTRMRLKVKPWIRCTEEAPKLDLDDYEKDNDSEKPLVPPKRAKSKSNKAKTKEIDNDQFMLSGVHPLTPCAGTSHGRDIQTPVSGRVLKNAKGQGDQSRPRSKQCDYILNSTPKSGQVIDLTDLPPANERPLVPPKRAKSKSNKAKTKEIDNDQFMLSGVHPLTPCAGTSHGRDIQTPVSGRVLKNAKGQGDQSRPRSKQCDYILNSTPKSGQVINLTDLPPAPLSPIPKVPEDSLFGIRMGQHVGIDDSLNDAPITTVTTVSKKYCWNSLYHRFLSCKTFGALERAVNGDANNVPALPSCFVGQIQVGDDKLDRLSSQKYMPADSEIAIQFKSDYMPIHISPDGNCFLRSLSRLVYGNENHHIEMRCRIVIDSVQNMKNYTDHDYLMREATHMHGKKLTHIGELYCVYCGIRNIQGDTTKLSVIQSVFKRDILRIRKEAEYCDNWQIHSAANVLNSKIVMLFPTKNIRDNVRADMQRVFLPKSLKFNCEFGLLWTALVEDTRKYDHIVPLIKRQSAAVKLEKIVTKEPNKKTKETSSKNKKGDKKPVTRTGRSSRNKPKEPQTTSNIRRSGRRKKVGESSDDPSASCASEKDSKKSTNAQNVDNDSNDDKDNEEGSQTEASGGGVKGAASKKRKSVNGKAEKNDDHENGLQPESEPDSKTIVEEVEVVYNQGEEDGEFSPVHKDDEENLQATEGKVDNDIPVEEETKDVTGMKGRKGDKEVYRQGAEEGGELSQLHKDGEENLQATESKVDDRITVEEETQDDTGMKGKKRKKSSKGSDEKKDSEIGRHKDKNKDKKSKSIKPAKDAGEPGMKSRAETEDVEMSVGEETDRKQRGVKTPKHRSDDEVPVEVETQDDTGMKGKKRKKSSKGSDEEKESEIDRHKDNLNKHKKSNGNPAKDAEGEPGMKSRAETEDVEMSVGEETDRKQRGVKTSKHRSDDEVPVEVETQDDTGMKGKKGKKSSKGSDEEKESEIDRHKDKNKHKKSNGNPAKDAEGEPGMKTRAETDNVEMYACEEADRKNISIDIGNDILGDGEHGIGKKENKSTKSLDEKNGESHIDNVEMSEVIHPPKVSVEGPKHLNDNNVPVEVETQEDTGTKGKKGGNDVYRQGEEEGGELSQLHKEDEENVQTTGSKVDSDIPQEVETPDDTGTKEKKNKKSKKGSDEKIDSESGHHKDNNKHENSNSIDLGKDTKCKADTKFSAETLDVETSETDEPDPKNLSTENNNDISAARENRLGKEENKSTKTSDETNDSESHIDEDQNNVEISEAIHPPKVSVEGPEYYKDNDRSGESRFGPVHSKAKSTGLKVNISKWLGMKSHKAEKDDKIVSGQETKIEADNIAAAQGLNNHGVNKESDAMKSPVHEDFGLNDSTSDLCLASMMDMFEKSGCSSDVKVNEDSAKTKDSESSAHSDTSNEKESDGSQAEEKIENSDEESDRKAEEKIEDSHEESVGKAEEKIENSDEESVGKAEEKVENSDEDSDGAQVEINKIIQRIGEPDQRATSPVIPSIESNMKSTMSTNNEDRSASGSDSEADSENIEKFYRRHRHSKKCKDFPHLTFLPERWEEVILNQSWKGLEIRKVAEGKGVFTSVTFTKQQVVCNYGGKFIPEGYVKLYLLPDEEKCNYLLEMRQKYRGNWDTFYLNHDNSTNNFGKYINHSKIHPNLTFKIYVTKEMKLDVLFFAKSTIAKGTELVWNYGNNFSGVKDCVESCVKCKKARKK